MLVFLVMFLFLQNFRATLIPTIAVPVVLLGTFGVLAALGYSINTLTMFAMVLAIGLLVDDAIVVVENVERVMSEEGLSPLEATRKSMDQITGALVGIALVLSAVFVPMAFFGGSTGVIYRQFSVTIVSAMALSVLVAIVLTPALCATMLKPLKKGQHASDAASSAGSTAASTAATRSYQGAVKGIVSRPKRFMLVFALMAGLMVYLFLRLPTAFLPDEDQGILFAQVQAPAGATQERTEEVMQQDGAALPREREGRGRVAVHRARLQLRRPRPEHRHRLRHAEGLGAARSRTNSASTPSPAARWAPSARSRMRWCSRSRRPR